MNNRPQQLHMASYYGQYDLHVREYEIMYNIYRQYTRVLVSDTIHTLIMNRINYKYILKYQIHGLRAERALQDTNKNEYYIYNNVHTVTVLYFMCARLLNNSMQHTRIIISDPRRSHVRIMCIRI